MKIILISLFVGVILYFAWRSFLKRLTDKSEFQRAESKILGTATTGEIEEIDFLIRYFKARISSTHWKKKIKAEILMKRLEELTEKYKINLDKK